MLLIVRLIPLHPSLQLISWCDRYWGPVEFCQLPGAFKLRLPFVAPMDHWLGEGCLAGSNDVILFTGCEVFVLPPGCIHLAAPCQLGLANCSPAPRNCRRALPLYGHGRPAAGRSVPRVQLPSQ